MPQVVTTVSGSLPVLKEAARQIYGTGAGYMGTAHIVFAVRKKCVDEVMQRSVDVGPSGWCAGSLPRLRRLQTGDEPLVEVNVLFWRCRLRRRDHSADVGSAPLKGSFAADQHPHETELRPQARFRHRGSD